MCAVAKVPIRAAKVFAALGCMKVLFSPLGLNEESRGKMLKKKPLKCIMRTCKKNPDYITV